MPNVTNPTEMVACDQLYKAALQQYNTSINDKREELHLVACVKYHKYNSVPSTSACDKCELKDTCASKSRIDSLNAEMDTLTSERVAMMKKYSELQDKIKTYLLS